MFRTILRFLILFVVALASFETCNAAHIAASGGAFTLQALSDGTVWSWGGNNGGGQLGDGTFLGHGIPEHVTGLSSVIAVAAGNAHGMALKNDGTVWTWGSNSNGQLGDGTQNSHPTPAQVPGLTNVIAIAAGANHSLALKNDGTVWAWGFNGNGQLGISNTLQQLSPVAVTTSGGLTGVTAIAAGANHSLAIKTGGSVWAWGLNASGQIGDNTIVNKLVPTQITLLAGVATAIAGGNAHSLAVVGGAVWAWGTNGVGQLGDNSTTQRNAPVATNTLTGITAVSAGNNHSLAMKNDGTVWAWGGNAAGQLGDTTTTDQHQPVQSVGVAGATEISAGIAYSVALTSADQVLTWGVEGALGDGVVTLRPVPTQISGLSGVIQASSGNGHILALLNDGTVRGLGANVNGQLGDNSTTRRSSPVAVIGLANVTAISAGNTHSLARKSDGTVWSWGGNIAGQLGNNTTIQQLAPVQVAGVGGAGFLTNIAAVSASGTNNFNLAVDGNGVVYAWGVNAAGQLGDTTTTQRIAPVAVSGLSANFVAVSAGGNHSLALKNDGTVWAWGNNANGQLGDTTFTNRFSPVQVFGLNGITAISAGNQSSFALKSDGSIWAWGSNNAVPGVFVQNTPSENGDLPSSLSVVAGNGYALFMLQIIGSNKLVGGWGSNNAGQLGDGTFNFSSDAVATLGFGGKIPASLAANSNSLAVMTDGTLWGWGFDNNGQLGDNPTVFNATPTAPVARGVADLTITKTHVGNFSAGSPGSYTITVQNVGQLPMTGITTVTDTLPSGMSFASGSGTGWTCGAVTGGASCTNPGPLTAGSSSVITLNVNTTPLMVPYQVNLATVSNANDVHPLNDVAGDQTAANTPTTVSLTSAPSPNPSTFGQSISLTATVTPASAVGTVVFGDGGAYLGAVPVTSGIAQLNTTKLGSGLRHLMAVFVPNPLSPYDFGVSPAIVQSVYAAPSSSLFPLSSLVLGGSKTGYLVATEDFNGDGKMDIVAVDAGSHSAILYLGDGIGGFTPSPGGPFQTGSSPVAVVAVDLNRDGKADLAFANQGVNTLTVLLGNGTGGFNAAPGSPFAVDFNPTSLTAADLNEDGTPRLAVTGLSSTDLLKFKHDSFGNFFTTTFPLPSGSRSGIAAGDFDGDGTLDLAISDIEGTVGINLKNSNGYAAMVSIASTLPHPQGILSADVNGDGKADLVVYDPTGIEVLLGNGSGGFAEAAGSPFLPGSGSITGISSVKVEDFNGDGKLDLYVVRTPAATSKGEVVIMLGNGNGGFTQALLSGYSSPSSNFQNSVVADFDRDGRVDLAVTDPVNDGVLVLRGVAGSQVSTVSVGPSSGTGSVQTFTGRFAGASDYHDLKWVQMVFEVALGGGGQAYCYVHYDVNGNQLWLYSDVYGFFVGPVTPGTPSPLLQGSLCAVNTAASTVSGYGSQLTVSVSLVFKQALALNVYMRANTEEDIDTDMVLQGTWASTPAPLATMTLTPSSGSVTNGTQQTFTLTYPDTPTPGFTGAAIGWEQFLVAVASNGGGQPFCYLHYDRAGNGLWMYSSDVGFFLGPVSPTLLPGGSSAPGTVTTSASSILNSSACTINTAGATVQNVGGSLVITVPITLKGPMVGPQKLFQRALTVMNVDTGFIQSGTFTVN